MKRLLLLAALVFVPETHAMDTAPAAAASTAPAPIGNGMIKVAVEVAGIGVIEAIDTTSNTITLRHEPIAALGWPAMTMVLKVATPDLLRQAKVGDRIHFTIYPDDMDSVITSIEPIKP